MIEYDPEVPECAANVNLSGTSTPKDISLRKRKSKQPCEDFLLEHCVKAMMVQPPPCPKIKTRSKALVDSITALISEMEVEDPFLGVEFTTELRKILNTFELRFDERRLLRRAEGSTSIDV